MLVVSSCVTSRDTTDNSGLAGTTWRLIELNQQQVAGASHQPIELRFDTEVLQQVSGFAGCNRFFGQYKQEGSALQFSALATTKMACSDMELEQSFVQMISQVSSFSRQQEVLKFFKGTEVLAIFTRSE
jgi:heat shock protein HslJ